MNITITNPTGTYDVQAIYDKTSRDISLYTMDGEDFVTATVMPPREMILRDNEVCINDYSPENAGAFQALLDKNAIEFLYEFPFIRTPDGRLNEVKVCRVNEKMFT